MKVPSTGIPEEQLIQIGEKFSTAPPGDFVTHGGKLVVESGKTFIYCLSSVHKSTIN